MKIHAFFAVMLATGSFAGEIVPFDSLTATNAALVRAVTDHPTLRRIYGEREFAARREHFEYLCDHMAECSILAHAAGLLTYHASRLPDGHVVADNRQGAKGSILTVYAADGTRIYFVQGSQRTGPFYASGRGVVALDFRATPTNTIIYAGTCVVKVDNAVYAMLAHLFSVFLTGTVDKNFDHVLRQPIELSKRALTEPQKLRDLIKQMPPEDRELLKEFEQLLP